MALPVSQLLSHTSRALARQCIVLRGPANKPLALQAARPRRLMRPLSSVIFLALDVDRRWALAGIGISGTPVITSYLVVITGNYSGP